MYNINKNVTLKKPLLSPQAMAAGLLFHAGRPFCEVI
jgi:hypothetical protein